MSRATRKTEGLPLCVSLNKNLKDLSIGKSKFSASSKFQFSGFQKVLLDWFYFELLNNTDFKKEKSNSNGSRIRIADKFSGKKITMQTHLLMNIRNLNWRSWFMLIFKNYTYSTRDENILISEQMMGIANNVVFSIWIMQFELQRWRFETDPR